MIVTGYIKSNCYYYWILLNLYFIFGHYIFNLSGTYLFIFATDGLPVR